MKWLTIVLVCLALSHQLDARAEDRLPGLSIALGGGVNVSSPFASAQVGWRFSGASNPFEVFLDYGFNSAISYFSFQTIAVGARTFLGKGQRFQIFHHAAAGLAVSSAGEGPVQNRDLGVRLLGPFFTQGIGTQALLAQGWTASLLVATGYPVWLRPELTVGYRF